MDGGSFLVMKSTKGYTENVLTDETEKVLTEVWKTEIVRKSIHVLIILVPLIAGWNRPITLLLLAAGSCLYFIAEILRGKGIPVPIISTLTRQAARKQDQGRFILGPITLATGTALALILYPPAAATAAIYSLAIGDSLSSLIGKTVGRIRIPLTGGKTLEGSLACYIGVFLILLAATGQIQSALILAATATLLEMLPTGDLDNILVPLGT